MLAALLAWARAEPTIRVALLNGSRANPAHTPDLLSDWDILCGVSDLALYDADAGWLQRFGRVRLLQRPNDGPGRAVWLVVLGDGARIDFTFVPLDAIAAAAQADTLTRVLVDKDGLLPPLPPPSEAGYCVARPTAAEFAASVNEFWWVAVYVAKGLWRGQVPYARHTLECIVRPELERVLGWLAAAGSGWRLNLGAHNKHLQAHLPPNLWSQYLRTLIGPTVPALWAALDAACDLMDRVGPQVARELGFAWNAVEAQGARELIAAIHAAPRDASTLGIA